MRRAWIWIPFLCALGCATPVAVTIEPTPGAEVARARTYAQAPAPPATATLPRYDAAVAEQIQLEIARQLAAKGYETDATAPDLRVAFRVSEESQTRMVLSSDPDANYSVPQESVEGALVIEVWNHAEDRLLWVGVGREQLFAHDDPAHAAVRAVQAILAELPAAAATTP